MSASNSNDYLALTPAGVRWAFARPVPQPDQLALQSVLAQLALPRTQEWLARSPAHAELLPRAVQAHWVERVQRELKAPDLRLSDFLHHVVAGLSGERKAALATGGGFCVAYAGYGLEQAEALCVASADYNEFASRQRARGWHGGDDMVSFHTDIAMLIPAVSFVPFWVDGVDYCLVLGGEPLINNPAFVEVVWSIKAAGLRFAGTAAAASAGADGAP